MPNCDRVHRLLNQLFIAIFSTTLLFSAAARFAWAQSYSTLQWNQGDQLTGTLEDANQFSLTWKSPAFRDPLQIRLDALSRVTFPKTSEGMPPGGEFRIEMHNHDILFGDLIGVDEQYLSFRNARMGEYQLERGQIHNLRRHQDTKLIYMGPRGIAEWTPVASENSRRVVVVINGQPVNLEQPSPWKEVPSGKLTTDSPGKIFHKLALPELCEIELHLMATAMPSFRIGFDRRPSENLRLETWEDVVVLVSRYDFTQVMTIKPDGRDVHLHLYLDRTQSKVYAYSHDGQKLAEMTFKQPLGQPHGLYIENLLRGLSLEYLCVSQWDGGFPKPVNTGEQRLLLTNGAVHYGTINSLDPQTNTLTVEHEGQTLVLPLNDVSHLVLSEEASVPPSGELPQISWMDGSFLSGQIEEASHDRIQLRTAYAPEPLVCLLAGAEVLSFPSTPSGSELPDRVHFPGGALAGSLIFEANSEFPILWKPMGGLNASPLATSGEARFLRGEKSYDLTFDATLYPDVLFLDNADIIPARISSATTELISFESPFCQARFVPTSHVRAVEFTASQIAATSGFSDPNWKFIDAQFSPEAQSVSFQSTGAIGHPHILNGDEVRFHIAWSPQPVTAVVNLFSSEVTKNSGDGLQVHLSVAGTRLTVETTDEIEMRQRNRMGMRYQNNLTTAICPDSQAEMRFTFQDGAAIVYVNGAPLKTIPLSRQTRRGNAFNLQAQLTQIPNRNIRNSNGVVTPAPKSAQVPFVVSRFQVESIRGSVIKQFILEESRKMALLVPRFNRDDPPTHVLLAPNGDLLRGRLAELTPEEIVFESKLEPLRLVKSRASALIWLPKPLPSVVNVVDKQPASSTTTSPQTAIERDADPFGNEQPRVIPVARPNELQLRLTHGYALSLKPGELEGEKLTGVSELLGDCQIPVSLISGVYLGHSTGEGSEVAYDQWVPIRAPEPDWDIPEDSGEVPGKQLIGRVMDDFELASIEGKPFRLSEHADKVVVLDFWATWCGPCVRALPEYIEATSGYDPEKVLFVALNLRETPQQIREFLSGQQYPFNPKVALDSSGEIADRFRVTGIPHNVVISPGSILQHVHVGFRPDGGQQLRAEIDDILSGKPAQAPAAGGN